MKLKYDNFDRHFEIFLKHNPLSTSEINLLLVSMVLFPLVSSLVINTLFTYFLQI